MVMLEEKGWVAIDNCLRQTLCLRPEEVLHDAYHTLDQHPLFCGHLESLQLDYYEGTLILTGQLPSFYLKQVLQTALKEQSGVDNIANRVVVVSSRGLSSVATSDSYQSKGDLP